MTGFFPGAPRDAAPASNLNPSYEEVERHLEVAREVLENMAGMLDGLADTSAMVPRSEWSVGEHGAHIAFTNIGFGMFAMGMEYPYGDGTQAGLAEANEVSLIGFPERDGTALAEHLRQGMENFATVASSTPVDRECPSPLGTMPLGVLTSYFLIHNLMHSCAIAAGLNRDFPVKEAHLPLVWPLLVKKLPDFVNSHIQAASGCIRLQSDGGFQAYLQIENGRLSVVPAAGGPVDCLVQGDPVHLFLVLIKMLTVDEAVELGRLQVSGSSPDLFARVMRALDMP